MNLFEAAGEDHKGRVALASSGRSSSLVDLDQPLEGIEVVIGGHEGAEEILPGLGVHPHLARHLEQLRAELLLNFWET